MTIDNSVFITQEISVLEHQLAFANELRKKISEAKHELTNSYCGLIESKDVFSEIKKENIEEIRKFKFAIAAEAKEILGETDKIIKATSPDRLKQLREYADVCERLNALRISGFFSAVKIDG